MRPLKSEVIWQDYNPYPKFQGQDLDPELVFIRDDMKGNDQSLQSRGSRSSSHFEEVLFPFPTGILAENGGQDKSDRTRPHG